MNGDKYGISKTIPNTGESDLSDSNNENDYMHQKEVYLAFIDVLGFVPNNYKTLFNNTQYGNIFCKNAYLDKVALNTYWALKKKRKECKLNGY